MEDDKLADLCARLPVHGRLHLDNTRLVLERSFHAKEPGELTERLSQRQSGEFLWVERFATYWLIRFIRVLPLTPS